MVFASAVRTERRSYKVYPARPDSAHENSYRVEVGTINPSFGFRRLPFTILSSSGVSSHLPFLPDLSLANQRSTVNW
ncbi:hypothetical protein MRB53_029744 [Persea americana]|uniref:Uncharacterized protein n=1 Tax=Persea americana TaxID=3435 RepID=A0ACC2KJ64_PERAE|nr:hypothetical protein MRB53_029744 [Persea americana]